MLAHLFQALSHPVRLQLLKILSTRADCICGEVIEIGSFSQATVLKHLQALQQAGFVQGSLDGPNRCYWINSETLQLFKQMVERL
ncbi:MAG: helix-turn-helix domain-containing protein [Cyanobacteria bacterium J06626_18]